MKLVVDVPLLEIPYQRLKEVLLDFLLRFFLWGRAAVDEDQGSIELTAFVFIYLWATVSFGKPGEMPIVSRQIFALLITLWFYGVILNVSYLFFSDPSC